MKSISTAFILFLMSQIFAVADEPQQVPDLSKAFPTEQLIGKMFINGIEYLNFNTDLDYAQLRTNLIAYLGNDWAEVPPEEPKTDLERKLHRMYQGRTTFNNARLEGMRIVFSVKRSRAAPDKKFIASLHFAKEAGQAAPSKP